MRRVQLGVAITAVAASVCWGAGEKLSAGPASIQLEKDDQAKVAFHLGKMAQGQDQVTLAPLDSELCATAITIAWSEDKQSVSVNAKKLPNGVKRLECRLEAKLNADASNKVVLPISLLEEKAGEWEARAIFGFHQAGASSSDSHQNYFFDFFTMRGLGNNGRVFDNRLNVWGNVRIASAPQQVDTAAATFIVNFAADAGKVPVNKIAQGGEFLTGLGLNLKKWDQSERVRMLELVGFWGANGAFSDPASPDGRRVFEVPKPDSAQYEAFKSHFPNVTAPYIGLTAPDRERFYRQYGAGIRLTGWETQRPYAPPSTYMVTLGQDQLITGGFYRGVVARADVFFPLPIGKEDGKWKFLYLFATANLRIAKPANGIVIALKPAPAAVNLYDPNVAIVSRASSRDTYRIGMGIDFVNLFNSWRASRSQ